MDMKGKLVHNVVKKLYKFRVLCTDGQKLLITVAAESEDAARLKLTVPVQEAELLETKDIVKKVKK